MAIDWRYQICNIREERRMTKKEVIVPADDLVCLGKDTLQELIRCKDCRFRDQFGFCRRWLWVSAPKMEDDEYCSGAERKEE